MTQLVDYSDQKFTIWQSYTYGYAIKWQEHLTDLSRIHNNEYLTDLSRTLSINRTLGRAVPVSVPRNTWQSCLWSHDKEYLTEMFPYLSHGTPEWADPVPITRNTWQDYSAWNLSKGTHDSAVHVLKITSDEAVAVFLSIKKNTWQSCF